MPESTLFTKVFLLEHRRERERGGMRRREGGRDIQTHKQVDREAGKRKKGGTQIDRQTDKMTETGKKDKDRDG